MEVALRRAYGYAFAPPLNRWGMAGLGTCPDGSPEFSDGTCSESPTITLTDPGIAPVPIVSVNPSALTPVCPPGATIVNGQCDVSGLYAPPGYNIQTPTSTGTCADGSPQFSDGSCAETAATPGTQGAVTAAATLAAALSRAIAPTTGIFGGAATSCPAGYVYGTPGQSVQIAPGIATVGAGRCIPSTLSTGIIPGVSNTTLAIAVAAVVVLMMMGKKR